MAGIQKFEDIIAWQKARDLCQMIFIEILNRSDVNDYKLKNQINGASGSIMDNIAEGFARGGNKEFMQFLYIARASCIEVKSQLYRAKDRTYISKDIFEKLMKLSNRVAHLITKFISYLANSKVKGFKYQ